MNGNDITYHKLALQLKRAWCIDNLIYLDLRINYGLRIRVKVVSPPFDFPKCSWRLLTSLIQEKQLPRLPESLFFNILFIFSL